MRRLAKVSCLAIGILTASGVSWGAVPLYTGLGTVHHAVTTKAPLAQKYFDQGLRLCYAFNHDEAIRAFREAARLDPSCAMAHWGIAYALGPNVNFPVDPDREKEAFGETATARTLAAKTSAHERAWVDALAKRYSDDPKADLKKLALNYKLAMGGVHEKFPADLDAATLYAESMMNLKPWQLWSNDGKPAEGTEEIVAVLESVFNVWAHPVLHVLSHLGATMDQ